MIGQSEFNTIVPLLIGTNILGYLNYIVLQAGMTTNMVKQFMINAVPLMELNYIVFIVCIKEIAIPPLLLIEEQYSCQVF